MLLPRGRVAGSRTIVEGLTTHPASPHSSASLPAMASHLAPVRKRSRSLSEYSMCRQDDCHRISIFSFCMRRKPPVLLSASAFASVTVWSVVLMVEVLLPLEQAAEHGSLP
jgi:hypothetical protein